MNKRPVILIAWGPCLDEQFLSHGMMILKNYATAISRNSGIPLVPLDHTCIQEYADMADGLMLPGAMGEYIKPGVPFSMKSYAGNRREAFSADLIDAFYKQGKPIMGICEGCQKLNCHFGGTIKLTLAEDCGVVHWGSAHEVTTEEGSMMRELWGEHPVVNSFHNFYVDELGKNFRITSWSMEHTPESIEDPEHNIYGFQFHPERMRGDEPFPCDGADGNLIFRRFLELCAK